MHATYSEVALRAKNLLDQDSDWVWDLDAESYKTSLACSLAVTLHIANA